MVERGRLATLRSDMPTGTHFKCVTSVLYTRNLVHSISVLQELFGLMTE
jgi:hypothetical protein